MIYISDYNSPIGKLTLASDGEKLIGLWIQGQKYFFSKYKKFHKEKKDLPIFDRTKRWLDDYFNGLVPSVGDLLLSPSGSEFSRVVWKVLREIQYGKTISYSEVAKKVASLLGKKEISPRAVASAISHNPILIIIPCHRVISANGKISGYAGGIEKKIKLLDFEHKNVV